MRSSQKGFSLVELIVVIAIMAVLVGLLTPALMKQIERGRYTKDREMVDCIATAVENAMAVEESYDDIMRVADHLPFDIYLSELHAKTSSDVGYIFAQEVMSEISREVKFGSKDVKGKNGYTDKIVKIHIDEDMNITVSVDGSTLKVKK